MASLHARRLSFQMKPVIQQQKGSPPEFGLFLRLDELEHTAAMLGRMKQFNWTYPDARPQQRHGGGELFRLPVRADHPLNTAQKKISVLLAEAKAHTLRK